MLAKLKELARARLDETQRGRVLVSTSGNGHSSTYEIPKDLSATDVVGMISQLIDRYEEAKAKLIEDGTASPTDTQIFDEMMAKLHPIRSVASDFRDLRVGHLVPDDE